MALQGRSSADPLRHPGLMTLPQDMQSHIQKFIKGEPVILGVAQVLIGLMDFWLWVMLKVMRPFTYYFYLPLVHDTLLFYLHLLGPICYVLSGALSIVSGKKTTKNVIGVSLGMNTASVVAAGLSLILPAITLDFLKRSLDSTTKYVVLGITVLKTILTVLEFCVALSLSAFGCHAVCCSGTSVVIDLSSSELGVSARVPYAVYDDVTFVPT